MAHIIICAAYYIYINIILFLVNDGAHTAPPNSVEIGDAVPVKVLAQW